MDTLINRLFHLALPFLLLLSACGPVKVPELPDMPYLVTLKPAVPTASAAGTLKTPQMLLATEPVLQPLPTGTEPATQAAVTAEAIPTLTANPTYIAYLPTPTETLLPPLELPTERPRAPALVAWTGLPTYAGDSDPGLLFQMDYDPDVWAQTEGNFGEIVLGHRQIDYCTITPWSGRGLPVDWKVSHEFRIIGLASYDVNIVTAQDVVKFVSYVGGDGRVVTGFQVSFNEQQDRCLQDAEAILGTLRSYAAIPTTTPTALPATPTP